MADREARVVMEPRDPGAGYGTGRDHLRASDADRELVVDALKTAFAQGRLNRSELVWRVGQALASKTYADLGRATAGIPPLRAVPAPPTRVAAATRPAEARPVGWKFIASVVSLIIVLPGLSVAFFATYYGSLYILLMLGFAAAAITGTPSPPGDGRRRVS